MKDNAWENSPWFKAAFVTALAFLIGGLRLGVLTPLGVGMYFLLKRTFGDREMDANFSWRNQLAAWIGIVVIVALHIGTKHHFGTTTPGSLFEQSSYDEMVYVRLYPGDQITKSYRLPAMISRMDGYYYISFAEFPNGGRVSFESSIGNGVSDLHLGTRVSVSSDDDQEWRVELTADPVSKREALIP